MAERRGLGAAFGGVQTSIEEQREIWLEALHPDAIWEGPTFDPPIQMIGREAVGHFMELLLEVVPCFSTKVVAYHPTSDPDTIIIESTGGGDTVDGGKYEQRYFSMITTKDGQAFRMREYCNPFQTYRAFGEERWKQRTGEIMEAHNATWPASQPPDPAALPGVAAR
jgi:ketosteroid isomerase-like protein